MKQVTLMTLTKAMAMIALIFVMACALTPASASAASSSADYVDNLPLSETRNVPDVTLYALSGNSATVIIRVTGGKVEGGVSLTIRQGHRWSTTLTLQRQEADHSWSSVTSTASSNTETSLSKSVSVGSYRFKAVVKIYDSNGKLIDSITRYSQIVQRK